MCPGTCELGTQTGVTTQGQLLLSMPTRLTLMLIYPWDVVMGHKASKSGPNSLPSLGPPAPRPAVPHHASSTLPAKGCCPVFIPPGSLPGLQPPTSPRSLLTLTASPVL